MQIKKSFASGCSYDIRSMVAIFMKILLTGSLLLIFLQMTPLLAEQKGSIGNFGQVSENVYRGQRLDEESDFKELADLGVQTVISLERFHSEDPELCKEYGLHCVRFPLILLGLTDADKFFDYSIFQKAFQFLVDEEHQGRKVYIHCFYGKDRTGALSAAFTIRKNACGKEEYNKDELWQKVDGDLQAYGFHNDLYPTLKGNIRSWVYELPSWICQGD